jgi:hypothetical protein
MIPENIHETIMEGKNDFQFPSDQSMPTPTINKMKLIVIDTIMTIKDL